MPMDEDELIERDRRRDLGAELLESVREMMAGRRAREYRVDPGSGTATRLRAEVPGAAPDAPDVSRPEPERR